MHRSSYTAPPRRKPDARLVAYNELRIEHDQGDVEIVVHNRAILPFTTDSEAVRRIHQVCCRLDDIAKRQRPATPAP